MHKTNAVSLFFFITFFTLGIAICLVYTSTTNSIMVSDSNLNKSQLSNSTRNNAIKITPKSTTLDLEQFPDDFSETFVDQQIAILNEQDGEDQHVISRGTRNRNTYYKINEIENSITPTPAFATIPEFKSATQEDIISTAPAEVTEAAVALSIAPAEPPSAAVQSITSVEPTKTAAIQSVALVQPTKTVSDQSTVQAKVSSNTETEVAQTAPAKVNSQYENDLDLLARLITAEAQGEPYEAQVAVGAVVLNRVESGLWADTIEAVIYQNINGYYQFTPVVNGWINKPAEPGSIKAAETAMNGADPTNGAQFYYDDKCTNTWILSKPVSIQIGHMIYAY